MANKKTLWPIGLTIVFLLYVGWLVSFLIFSGTQRTDLVEKDYYQKEMAYQGQIDRIERVRKHQAKISWHIRSGPELVLALPMKFIMKQTRGEIHFYRPSDARMDQRIPLQVGEDGKQIIDLRQFAKGKWVMKISWRVNNDEYYDQQEIFIR